MIMAQEQDTRETPGHKLILVAPCTEMKKVIEKVEELAGRQSSVI
jgi:hypothetical protein